MRLGDWVRINSMRPHKEKYRGYVGQVRVITNRDIVYVQVGENTPNFYIYELEEVAAPRELGGIG